MTTQVTQCPNCETSFRVTAEQLNIADGAVRCGSCLHIFKAMEHRATNTDLTPDAVATTTTTIIDDSDDNADAASNDAQNLDHSSEQNPDQNPKTSLEHGPELASVDALYSNDVDDKTLDDIFDDDIFADDTSLDSLADELLATNSDDGTTFNNDNLPDFDEAEHAVPPHQEATDEAEIPDDMLISDDTDVPGINDEEDDETDAALFRKASSFSHSFLNLKEGDTESSSMFSELDNISTGDEEDDEAWAKKLLEEEIDEDYRGHDYYSQTEETDPEQASEGEDLLGTQPASDIFDFLDEGESDLDPELQDILNERDHIETKIPDAQLVDEFVLGADPMLAGERIGEDKRALLANIQPEPVEIAASSGNNPWVKRAWAAAIIVALLVFAGQYINFNFDRLARDKEHRANLSSLCELIGCKIPDLNDISLIRSSNLMVRSHSEIANALVVDAVLINRADFKQPFPIMELQFTDLRGAVVAGRLFKPSEYLAGELVGLKMMPTRQPVHVSLEIVDPGEQAVNYQLGFHPLSDS